MNKLFSIQPLELFSIQPLGDALVEVVYIINDNDNVILHGVIINDAYCAVDNIASSVINQWLRAINKDRGRT